MKFVPLDKPMAIVLSSDSERFVYFNFSFSQLFSDLELECSVSVHKSVLASSDSERFVYFNLLVSITKLIDFIIIIIIVT